MAEPPITLRAIHDSGPLAMPIDRIVIHATAGGLGYPRTSAAGQALGTARYFQNPAAGGSAHYCCDVATETHCVPDNIEAWHAPPNGHSLGIEICAEATYTREQWLSPQVWPAVVRAAARCRELCDRFGVPKTRLSVANLLAGQRGICGHVDVSQAWHQSSHTDPGPGFPWDQFMAEVVGPAPAPIPVTVLEDDVMKAYRNTKTGEYAIAGPGFWRSTTLPYITLIAARGLRLESKTAQDVPDNEWSFFKSFYSKSTDAPPAA